MLSQAVEVGSRKSNKEEGKAITFLSCTQLLKALPFPNNFKGP